MERNPLPARPWKIAGFSQPWVCSHALVEAPPPGPPQAPAFSHTHVLACTHPHTFAHSPSPCSFLRARAQLESWLHTATFQKRLFIKKKKKIARKEIIIIITLRALAVKALRECGEGAVAANSREHGGWFSCHVLSFFFSPGPTSPPLFLPVILGNENNLFNDGSSLSLVTDLLGDFLLSSAENMRLGCGSHL